MGRLRVTLPDGIVHVVCTIVDGVLQDPHVLMDYMDAQAVENQVRVAHKLHPQADVQISTFKVRVVPEGRS